MFRNFPSHIKYHNNINQHHIKYVKNLRNLEDFASMVNHCTRLAILDLSFTNIRHIPTHTFAQLSNIPAIFFKGCHMLVNLHEYGFSNSMYISYLNELYMSYLDMITINTIKSKAFCPNYNLKNLNISHNEVSVLKIQCRCL